jgi:hypothetical protein
MKIFQRHPQDLPLQVLMVSMAYLGTKTTMGMEATVLVQLPPWAITTRESSESTVMVS